MLTAAHLDEAARAHLVTRLKSIEGQARGIQRMFEEGRDCKQIIDQLLALRAAAHAVTMQALEPLALHCLREAADRPEEAMSDLFGVVSRLLR